MASEQFDALVLKDAEGNYYIFDCEAFERARAPEDLRAKLDAQLDDVGGFILNTPQPQFTGRLPGGLPIIGQIGGQPPIITGFVGPVNPNPTR